MPLQNFIARSLPTISAVWLNAVDVLKFTIFNDATTKAAARAALELSAQVSSQGTDAGIVNASVVTLIGPITGYTRVTGSTVSFTPAVTNTGPATLNVNGTGAAAIINQLGNALTGGELSMPLVVVWTGTAWRIILGSILPSNARTPGEISATITPLSYAYDNTDYSNLLRYMTQAQINSIAAGDGGVDTQSGWAAAMTMAVKAAGAYTSNANNGLTILAPAGNYRVNSPIVLPRFVKILAAGSRRGAGTPPTGRGTGIQAAFAGPVFQAIEASLETYDVLIDGINVSGNKALYPAGIYPSGMGIIATKANGITLRNMVVSDFAVDNIRLDGAGAYGLECIEIYSATAGNANFYIDGQYSKLVHCTSDGGVYSVFNGTNGDGLDITTGCHFEGPTTRCLHILAKRFNMVGGRLIPTITATGGAYINGTGAGLSNVEIFHQNGGVSFGVELDTGGGAYRIDGCDIGGFSTCVILREGTGTMTGSTLSGNTTGLELVGGSYNTEIVGNHIGGVTNSILHTSGNGRWNIGPNRLADASNPTVFKPMTVTAGFPIISGNYEGATPSIASVGALSLPFGAKIFSITGTTNITSINASGWSNLTVTLVFTGILTVVNGANLKLTANFVTAAGSALTLACDGTNFYEVGRKA